MTTPNDGGTDRPQPDGTPPPAWDSPPQPPAWDRPNDGGTAPYAPPEQGQQYGQPGSQQHGQQYGGPQDGGQAGWGAPPGYAGGGYGGGYGQPAQTETKSIIALVLAIGSFVVCPLVPAVIALVLAGSSRREIEASGGRLTGLGLVKASRIISWINIGLVVAGIALFALLIAVGVSIDETTATTPY